VLTISATTIKSFFQYRCERQLRYNMAGKEALSVVKVDVANGPVSPWALEGLSVEKQVVEALSSTNQVFGSSEKKLTIDQTIEFLRGNTLVFACQLRLELPADDSPHTLRRRLGLPDGIVLSPAFPDLVERVIDGDQVRFRIVDIKAVHQMTLFHRAQVAYYALLLDAFLQVHGIAGSVLPDGEVWHLDPKGGQEVKKARFRLAGYIAQVEEVLRNVAPRVAGTRLEPGHDDTRFHLYFKCEQCHFLPHCKRAVDPSLSPSELDLSAIPGMSAQTKFTLHERLNIHDVKGLAERADNATDSPEVALSRDPRANWHLRANADRLVRRAISLVEGKVIRLPDHYTHQMPGAFEVAIHLLVDKDPVEGRLAALGYRCEWQGRQTETQVVAIGESGPGAEALALAQILGRVVSLLDELDQQNAQSGSQVLRAHLFVYETSEAIDLAAALGRHLSDRTVRGPLLHMLRMFPPEEVAPEPDYKGVPHLPATAVRSVLDGLYALPVRVSHDLRSVTDALASRGLLTDPYQPEPRFENEFSARLNIDLCRALKTDPSTCAAVESDVRARLLALASLVAFLRQENQKAASPFLRLEKQPFRWRASFDPLNSDDLELIRAHESLQLKSQELEALAALAAPWQVRRDKLRCFARLQLIDVDPAGGRYKKPRLWLRVPPESMRAEIETGAVGLILTNDHPNLRLDPKVWPRVYVDLVDVKRSASGLELVVDGDEPYDIWRSLIEQVRTDWWFLDQAHRDLTWGRMDSFLDYLAHGPPAPPQGTPASEKGKKL